MRKRGVSAHSMVTIISNVFVIINNPVNLCVCLYVWYKEKFVRETAVDYFCIFQFSCGEHGFIVKFIYLLLLSLKSMVFKYQICLNNCICKGICNIVKNCRYNFRSYEV